MAQEARNNQLRRHRRVPEQLLGQIAPQPRDLPPQIPLVIPAVPPLQTIESLVLANLLSLQVREGVFPFVELPLVPNTWYSAPFIQKTLRALQTAPFTTKLESDVDLVWDMSVTREVAEFLMGEDICHTVLQTIDRRDEAHLIEMMIGILANIVSHRIIVSREVIHAMVTWVTSSDSLILIQVMRFLDGVRNLCEEPEYVCRDFIMQLTVILHNESDFDLLLLTMRVLFRHTNQTNSNIMNKDIASGVLRAYNVIYNQERVIEDMEYSPVQMDTPMQRQAFELLIANILSLCYYLLFSYHDDEIESSIFSIKPELEELIIRNLIKDLDLGTLFPLDDTTFFYFRCLLRILPFLRFQHNSHVFVSVVNALNHGIATGQQNLTDFVEMTRFLLTLSDVDSFERGLKFCNNNGVEALDYCLKCKIDEPYDVDCKITELMLRLKT